MCIYTHIKYVLYSVFLCDFVSLRIIKTCTWYLTRGYIVEGVNNVGTFVHVVPSILTAVPGYDSLRGFCCTETQDSHLARSPLVD